MCDCIRSLFDHNCHQLVVLLLVVLVIRSVFVDKRIMCIAQRSPACCVITAVTRLLCAAVTRLLCDHKHLMCTAAIRSLFDHSGYPLGVCSLYACGFSTEVCAASATVKQEQVFDGNVLCDVCGRFSQWDRCRVTSKKEGLWKCGNCHSKENTLRRCFGQWPLETFQGLDVDKKRALMAKISEMSSVGVAREAEDFINQESHSNSTSTLENSCHSLCGKPEASTVWQLSRNPGLVT